MLHLICLCADINKSLENLHLDGLVDDESNSSNQQISACKRVADARRQLVELQQQVLADGQASASFITALSAQITAFAQQLNDIKARQRADYGSLLQQEQQLVDELAVLHLSTQQEACCQPDSISTGFNSSTYSAQKVPVLSFPAGQGGSGSAAQPSTLAGGEPTTFPVSSRSSTGADCLCRSPDRPSRQVQSSSGSRSSDGSSSSSLPPEVQVYDAYVARHGSTGGWHPDDHNTFIKILRAHK